MRLLPLCRRLETCQRQLPRSLRGDSEPETRQLIEDAAAAYEAALTELERAWESASCREDDAAASGKALTTAGNAGGAARARARPRESKSEAGARRGRARSGGLPNGD